MLGRSGIRVRHVVCATALLAGLLTSATVQGQPTAPASRPAASDAAAALRFRLVTIGPGQEIYERFGHNALWLHDPAFGANTDIAFNYGIFDMGQSGFILRFLLGRMWYWVDWWNVRPMIEMYRQQDRGIWTQQLELSPAQRLKLRSFLVWNVQPENRSYRYDYYTDNCSTRVRDALDRVLGGQIRQQLDHVPTGRTYRWHTQVATACDPIMYTGLLLVLGHPVDRPISAWEECFLPEQMQKHLRNLTVIDEQGHRTPLISNESQIYQSTRPPLPDGPPHWLAWYLLIGLAWGALLAWLGRMIASPAGPLPDKARKREAAATKARRRMRMLKSAFMLSAGLWLLLVSFTGWFMAGIWLLSSHVAAYYNENLLHFSPLALPLLVLTVFAVLDRGWARRWALWLGLTVAGSSLLGFLLKVLPWFYQVNGQLIALALPIHIGLLWGVYELARRQAAPAPRQDAGAAYQRE